MSLDSYILFFVHIISFRKIYEKDGSVYLLMYENVYGFCVVARAAKNQWSMRSIILQRYDIDFECPLKFRFHHL